MYVYMFLQLYNYKKKWKIRKNISTNGENCLHLIGNGYVEQSVKFHSLLLL